MKEWGSVPLTPMANLQLSGLASGLDWKSLVDQLMEIEAAPITRIEREQTLNSQRSAALKDLGTKMSSLQTAVKNLKDQSLFSGRSVTSGTTGSKWSLSASAGAPTGSYQIAVSQLATKARRDGAANITGGIAATSDVTGVTLATMRTAGVVTSGTFTINGHQITLATTDSLDDVFDRIATATDNDITPAYDPVADKITFESVSDTPIVLGAANDTSNFLQVLKLTNNGSDTVTSYGTLGAMRTSSTLAGAGLNAAITNVDGSGNGTFSINGTAITFNVNTDTLSTVLKRINASSAGVTASYDAVNDRVSLVNNTTGDLGITLSETAGGLLGALGLTSGYTATSGKNAQFSIDGGPTLVSASNTLTGAAHGINGLSVTVDSETTQTISVGADTAKMKDKIKAFVSAYNAVQQYIDDKSKITTTAGKVTTSVLSSNRDVQDWAHQLRSLAFAQISGAGGTIDRLDDLGIDLDRDGQMSIESEEKLDAALANHPGDVEAFFTTATTGFATKLNDRLDKLIDTNSDSQQRITDTNNGLDRQIDDLQRRLDQQRELLTNSFIAMESAQSRIQQQGTAISNAFGLTSSSSKK